MELLLFILCIIVYCAPSLIINRIILKKKRLGQSRYAINTDLQGVINCHFRKSDPEEDINVLILCLISSIMKSDGVAKRAELDLVKQFLLDNYGELKGNRYLQIIQKLIDPNVFITDTYIANELKKVTDYDKRYNILDFLYKLAASDLFFSTSEKSSLENISKAFGIKEADHTSIYTRHIASRRKKSSGSDTQQNGQTRRQQTRSQGASQNGSSSSRSYRNSAYYPSGTYRDPYRVLGITRSASNEEVKKAYRSLAMKYHPDKVEGLGEEVKKNAEEQFRIINEAYERIKAARRMK